MELYMKSPSNELLRSAHAIAARRVTETNWSAFATNVERQLLIDAGIPNATDEQLILRATCTARNYRLRPQPQQPIDAGWYWYRKSDQHRWSVLEVWSESGRMCCSGNRHCPDDHNFVENLDGEWYGPINPPVVDDRWL